jgi:hypothetical protein
MSSLLRRIVLFALVGGILFDALAPGNAAGLNAAILMAAFLTAALLVAGREGIRRMDPADAWLAPAALALASMAVVRADHWLVTLDLLLAVVLAAGAVGCLAGGRVTRGLVPRVLELAVGAVAAAAIGAGSVLRAPRPGTAGIAAMAAPSRWRRLGGRLRRGTPVARGLLIALPVAAVFVALFASADAVFARLTSDVLAWQPDVDLEDLLFRTVVVTVVAWGTAGLLGLAAGLLPGYVAVPALRQSEPDDGAGPAPHAASAGVPSAPVSAASSTAPPVSPSVDGPPLPPLPTAHPAGSGWYSAGMSPQPGAWLPVARTGERPPPRLGSTEAATILVVVDVLFAAFVALQLAYLFGGTDTMAMAGLTYAEYARRGFFELALVAVLAGLLVVTLDLAVGSRSRGQLAGALVLLALTAVVLASALLRLRLYQSMYGWTELRLVVLVAIAWLAVALAVTAGLLLARRTRWTLHALGIMVLVAVAAMNVIGPQAFVTERNLERAIDPSLVPAGGSTGLDTDYLTQLGDEAVAPVVDAWGRLGQADRDALAPALAWRQEQLRTDPSLQGWPSWNLTRERARAALQAWEAAQGTASRRWDR